MANTKIFSACALSGSRSAAIQLYIPNCKWPQISSTKCTQSHSRLTCFQLFQILTTFTACQGQGKIIQWKDSVKLWQIFNELTYRVPILSINISKHNRIIIDMDITCFLDWAETSVLKIKSENYSPFYKDKKWALPKRI